MIFTYKYSRKSKLLNNLSYNFEVNTIRLFSSKKKVEIINPRVTEIIKDISNTKSFITALTHKSYSVKHSSLKSYETLEFLGDSLLELYVSIFLYSSFPEYSEGKLTETRTSLVQGSYLASLSSKLELYKYLNSDAHKSVDFTNATSFKSHKKVLCDIFESFTAALFFERGGKVLFEFLSLTVLNKVEFQNKFNSFNPNIAPLLFPIIKNEDAKIEVPLINKEEVKIGNIAWNIEITDNRIKVKLSEYLDKSLKNQDDTLHLLTKNNELMMKLVNNTELVESLIKIRSHDYSIND